MTDDDLRAAMIRDLEKLSRQVQESGLAKALASISPIARTLNDPLFVSYVNAVNKANEWLARMYPPASPSAKGTEPVREVPSKAAIVEALETETARLRAVEAENARLRAAEQEKRSRRLAIQRDTTEKTRAAREEFAQIVDDRLASAEDAGLDMTLDDAVVYAIKKTRRKKSLRSWLTLTEKEQKREKRAAKARYRRARPSR